MMRKIPLTQIVLAVACSVSTALIAATEPVDDHTSAKRAAPADSLENLQLAELNRPRRRLPRRPGQPEMPVEDTGGGRTIIKRETSVPVEPEGGDWQSRRWSGKEGGLPTVNFEALGALPPVPDRWRIVDSVGYKTNVWDPYSSHNPLKADRPVFGKDWFFNLGVISDSILNARNVPVPVGNATTADANSLDTIGDGDQFVFNQNLIVETVLYQGDTVFRPPDYEFRFTPVFNFNYVDTEEAGLVKVDPSDGRDGGTSRTEGFIGIQALFVDKHLRNVSSSYDFDSIRFGIQPMTADFRGFLFLDQPLGIRLFGTRKNNIFQYNIGAFRRLDKDINSGLNDVTHALREDDVFLANLYWQDFPSRGFISQATVIYNRNREKNNTTYDENGFIARPGSLLEERGRNYDATYIGYSGDGHFGRMNLSTSLYHLTGRETNTRFDNSTNDLKAWFAAAEASVDFDWIRLRLSGLYGSGDDDPFDDESEGFDAIFENPQFAGADTSYYISQSVPLIGGGGVALSGRNAVLNSLRSSKEQGQSNFINPGMKLVGIGADFELMPELRLSTNINQMWFDDTAVLETLRQQGSIDEEIGTDISVAMIYRPLFTQNVVFRLSGAMLRAGDGFKDLYGDEDTPYSVLGNVILTY